MRELGSCQVAEVLQREIAKVGLFCSEEGSEKVARSHLQLRLTGKRGQAGEWGGGRREREEGERRRGGTEGREGMGGGRKGMREGWKGWKIW